MSYVKTSWVARTGTALKRFLFTDNGDGSMDLTADPTGVSTNGTPFTTDNMNHIEQGIKDNDDRLDQGVKTTDSPEFAGLTSTAVNFIGGGKKIKGSIQTTAASLGGIFTLLSVVVPTIGNKVVIHGAVYTGTEVMVLTYMERISAIEVSLNGFKITGQTIGTLVALEDSTTEVRISIAW